MPKRLMIFIDGQNLFYGCRTYEKDFRLDFDKFISVLKNLESDRELIDVCYYGSIRPRRRLELLWLGRSFA